MNKKKSSSRNNSSRDNQASSIQETVIRTEEEKAQLRQLFIDKAKSYIGVPYAKRYQPEDAPIAPLYLDCCGLIRQVLVDLSPEFGFTTGRWNQCYQFDTLPIVVEEKDMKPGDLIFYEGSYLSEKSKPQKHNMVHVEIYLGNGAEDESCIGSRFRKGNVSLFDSYKFESSVWKLVKIHYRSIDTWLSGVCRSCCPEHPWTIEPSNVITNKKSIFYYDSDDEKADHDDTAQEAQVGLEEQGHCDDDDIYDPTNHAFIPTTTTTTTTTPPITDSTNSTTEHHASAISLADINIAATSSTDADTDVDASHTAASYPLRLKEMVTAARTTDDTDPSLQALSTPPIDTTEHPTTSLPPTTTTATTTTATTTTQPAIATSAPNSSRLHNKKKDDKSMVYCIEKANGYKLIKSALDKRGWKESSDNGIITTKYGLKWVQRRSDIDYRSHVEGQLVCHIANNNVICNKVSLLLTMREYFCKPQLTARSPRGAASPTKPSSTPTVTDPPTNTPTSTDGSLINTISPSASLLQPPWLPETYQLESHSDVQAALKRERKHINDHGIGLIWIYKPACFNRGKGIEVFQGLGTLERVCLGVKKPLEGGKTDLIEAPKKGIVQVYIQKPLLVGKERFKFDIRCYLLIARNQPTVIAFYHPGYCRLTLKPYTLEASALADSRYVCVISCVYKI